MQMARYAAPALTYDAAVEARLCGVFGQGCTASIKLPHDIILDRVPKKTGLGHFIAPEIARARVCQASRRLNKCCGSDGAVHTAPIFDYRNWRRRVARNRPGSGQLSAVACICRSPEVTVESQ